jgi:hypothetical protein
MSHAPTESDGDRLTKETEQLSPHPATPGSAKERRKSPSMHEGIAVWCDCCSCEAEPYWIEIAQSMGMELGSDYEDPER